MEVEQVLFKKGDVIFREGTFELWMYDLQFGSIAFYGDYGSDHQMLVSTLEAPTFLGEWGFFESMPRKNTAVALEDCVCYKITHENLTEYFTQRPAKIIQIIEVLCAKHRNLTKEYMEACDTIAEYLDKERRGVEKPKGLLERMKKFAVGGIKGFRKF